MVYEVQYLSLLIIASLALIAPVLSARLRLPVVTAEIVCGIVIGRSGLDLIKGSQWLDFLAAFGFVFLMFLSGLEIDFTMIKKDSNPSKGNSLVFGLKLFALTFLIAYIISLLLGYARLTGNALYIALTLSTTSVGIVLPLIIETRLNKTDYGQNILLSALVCDFLTIFLLPILIAQSSKGVSPELFMVLLLFIAFLAVYRLTIFVSRNDHINGIFNSISKMSEIWIRGSIALLLLFVVLSQMTGTEVVLGAFIAGALLSLLYNTQKARLETNVYEKLYGVGYGFLIPVFFISVGINFQFRYLLESWGTLILVPVLLLAAYIVKVVPSLFLFGRQYSRRLSLSAGILLSSRLSFIIAASAIGLKYGIISEAVNSAIILVVVITCTISPVLFARLIRMPAKKSLPKQT